MCTQLDELSQSKSALEITIQHKKRTFPAPQVSPSCSLNPHPHLQSNDQSPDLMSCFIFFLEFYINGIIWYIFFVYFFSFSFLLLNKTLGRLIYIALCCNTLIIFCYGVFHCVNTLQLIYPFCCQQMCGCFLFLSLVDVSINIMVHAFCFTEYEFLHIYVKFLALDYAFV